MRKMLGGMVSLAYLPAVVAAVFVSALALFADHQNHVLFEQQMRAETLAKVNVFRARLEGMVNGNIQLVRGLVSTIVSEPYMGQERFAQLAANLFRDDSQLRNVAAAPDLVIAMIHPRAGNEAAIGLDYRNNDAQREGALRARATGRLVLVGPVKLKQGGNGFIGRFPVFIDPDGPKRRFWGIVSAVIDVDRLYRDSGLYDMNDIEIGLSTPDGTSSRETPFFGRPNIVDEHPVVATISLPSTYWRIKAVPRAGWNATPDNAWWLRGLMLIAGAFVVVPIAFGGRYYGERRRNYLALERSEKQLRRLSRRLELALDASRIGVWEHDVNSDEVIWDDRLYEIYGTRRSDAPRRYEDWTGSIHPDDLAKAEKDFQDAVTGDGHYSSAYRIVRPDGGVRHIRTHATLFLEPSPKMIGAEWDVTDDVRLNKDLERAKVLAETRSAELEVAKARIEFIALHDSLTGLPNRRYLDEHLVELAEESVYGDLGVGLLHIDLDRFKQINDTLGHAAGDAMLIHAAQVLRSNVREDDFIARIGGDEFVAVTRSGKATLQDMADRIIAEMRQPVSYDGHQCRFGVSIGIASDAGARIPPDQLLVNADIALYRAKSLGRSRYEFFTDQLQSTILRSKRISDGILGGLERNEFVAYYQPQFDARTLEISGVEALVRWNHPTEGVLSPDAFLTTAEELNVVSAIDRLVLQQTLANFTRWSELGLAIPRVSVNVSARRLRDEELIAGLGKLDIKPGTVSFELMESIFLDDTDDLVAWNVDRIKELGIDIEIDDFGTGHASIVSLLKLQPRRLKIDRQLIQPIVGSARQRHLVESIIEIGKTLGVEVVAEGVESMQHVRILKKMGCAILQGFAFGLPMSAADLETYVRSRQWRAAS